MRAMVTMGHGGIDKIVMCTDWPVPTVGSDEVVVRVSACGLNNTDVNTRVGWYSSAVVAGTSDIAHDSRVMEEPSWGGSPIEFPRIQGADICGEIVTVGANIWELEHLNRSG
mgnify:CR=1 FL=1